MRRFICLAMVVALLMSTAGISFAVDKEKTTEYYEHLMTMQEGAVNASEALLSFFGRDSIGNPI